MIVASALSTIEGIIPYLILACVVLFFIVRLVVMPLVDALVRARQRKDEHRE